MSGEAHHSAEDERIWIYGYGRTKHIQNAAAEYDGYRETVGLCGAYGGYPWPEPSRPPCKRCLKIAAQIDGLEGGSDA